MFKINQLLILNISLIFISQTNLINALDKEEDSPISASATKSKLTLVRERLLASVSDDVEAARAAYLAKYGLTLDIFQTNSKDFDELLEADNNLIEETALEHEKEFPDHRDNPNIKAIDEVAEKVFSELRDGESVDVTVLNHPEFPYGGVNVSCKCTSDSCNKCWVTLNVNEHAKHLDELSGILRHEYAHTAYKDSIKKGFCNMMAWVNSRAEKMEIVDEYNPVQRLVETRADVYAAVNSPVFGENLINAFKKSLSDIDGEDDTPPSHPKLADRIALLELIRAELESAADSNSA